MKNEGRGKELKFKLEDYTGKVCMHCNTEEKAEKFCMFLHENGRTWWTKTRYIDKTCYLVHKEDTCYNFNRGTYCGLDFYKEKGFKILEFDEFDWED